ncbi:MAG: DNA alkylation repair protein [Paludibacter sp.]|nr:DNA alkylation repair protein [Paludibacter sp.]
MKYSLVNPGLDIQLAEIRRKIRLSMNGIVSDQMTRSGIIYKSNFGVSIPRIREIAATYTPGHDLAQRLWMLEIRETKIMATLLEPIDKFSAEMAGDWVAGFDQIEIVEQSVMNLFSKLSYSDSLCIEWIQSDSVWIQITGFILAARITDKLSHSQITLIIEKAIEISSTTDFHLYKAVGLCLSRLCRNNEETAGLIRKGLEGMSGNLSVGQNYISMEVKQEMIFLGFK